MEYRNLGRSGVKVAKLCIGCMNFGGAADEPQSFEMIDYAIAQGANFFDTANGYNAGKSEEVLGNALKRDGKRNSAIVATKVHFPVDKTDPNAQGNSRRHIIDQCDVSLRRLKTDWIDLYQLHRASPDTPIDETLRALDDLIRAGKVRYIGTSVFASWQLMEALWVSHELGLNRIVSEQPPYHMLDRQLEKEVIPMAISYGIAILPWSPLAGGFLTGKYVYGEKKSGTRLGGDDVWSQWHCGRKEAFDVVDVISEIAKKRGNTPAQISLAWCAGQPGITSPVIGPKNMDQLKENLGAADIVLTTDEEKQIDAVSPPGTSVVPYIWSPWVQRESFQPNVYR